MRYAFLILFLFPFALRAETSINENYLHYIVSASTSDEILDALNKSSLPRLNGKMFHGKTNTYVKWHFLLDKKNSYCKIDQLNVTVDINYKLPKLAKDSIEDNLKLIWDKYYNALLEHEKGHGAIAIDAAKEIEGSLLTLPASNNCKKLNEKANILGSQILDKHKLRHAPYDTKTEHGKTQGVNLQLYL